MVKVALCDDNKIQIGLLLDYLNLFNQKHPGMIEVTAFYSGTELLDKAKNDGFDIYILDLIMPEINGMDVARELRKAKDKGKIVFLTSTKDYVFEAFSVKASDYLLKPISPEKLFEKIRELCGEIEEEKPFMVTVKSVKGECIFPLKDILFIENVNRSPHFHLAGGKVIEGVSRREKFSSVISEYLENGFTLCSISTAVNLNRISFYKKDSGEIILGDNEKSVFCSRSMSGEFRQKYEEHNMLT